MTIGALVSLAVSLQNLPPEKIARTDRAQLKKLIASLWEAVEAYGTKRVA